MTQPDTTTLPDLSAIADLRARLQQWVRTTPVLEKADFEPVPGTAVNFKFELLQASGTFKARGAFSNLLALDDAQRAAGVTCVSAGNHAVAVAYAAMRSEEHTSELQSLMRISYAVFCLTKTNTKK